MNTTLTNQDLIVLIERVKTGLICRATGSDIDSKEYSMSRDILIRNSITKDILPVFLKSCRTPDEFWGYIQPKFKSYQERRAFITSELNRVLDTVEHYKESEMDVENIRSYNLGERLGSGGFGVVHKYHHKLLEYDFAIKVLDPIFTSEKEKGEFNARFFREAKILFTLDHPNIVKVYDTGLISNKPFIRMELVHGITIDEHIVKNSIVNFERSKKPIIALLEGLSFAHKMGIIHRDLKPSNFMVTSDGRFKIIDFGISAYIETEAHTKLTKTGEGIAGGLYTDPLLMDNPKLRDPRSDVYSVGAIWYFLLTGRAPSGSDMRNVLLQSGNVTSLQADIVLKCISQDIENRYESCDDLLSKLKPIDSPIENSTFISSNKQLTEVTRLYLFDFLIETYNHEMEKYYYSLPDDYSEIEKVFFYHGRQTEFEFLRRVYNLAEIPSNSSRFQSFEEEIKQVKMPSINYPMFWLFEDERFGLKSGNDEILLKFLSEMLHPVVRKENSDWQFILKKINELINVDGYEIYECNKIFNRSVYSYRVLT